MKDKKINRLRLKLIFSVFSLIALNVGSMVIFFFIKVKNFDSATASFSSLFWEMLIYQLIIILIYLVAIFIFARAKLILPIEKIVNDVKKYKFGLKIKKRTLNSELDVVQNEFVDLVNSLEKEKEEQNRIIASISHDIKTPLTSIIGYSSLIESNNLSKEEILKYNKKINDKALHVKSILNTFDDYIINQTNQTLNLTQIPVSDLINYLKEEYEYELKNSNIDFTIESKLKNEKLNIDIIKIKRVFSNIISNSVRYLNNKGTIKIRITRGYNNYIFTISDNGPGVDPKILDKVFDPLFTTDTSRKISGLGLSICKDFIQKHKGKISAYNDDGFVIKFTIPIKRLT